MNIQGIISWVNENQGLVAVGIFILTLIGFFIKKFLFSEVKKAHTQRQKFGDRSLGIQSGRDTNVKVVQEIKKFSGDQSIKLWPSHLGGNDSLDLNGLGKLIFLNNEGGGILLGLDVSQHKILNPNFPKSIDMQDGLIAHFPKNDGFKISDISISSNPDDRQKYIFDLFKNKKQIIDIMGRRFVVTLNESIEHAISGISSAMEYKFGISEQ